MPSMRWKVTMCYNWKGAGYLYSAWMARCRMEERPQSSASIAQVNLAPGRNYIVFM